MAYQGSKISTGRVKEDLPKIKENLGKLFGESPLLRKIQEEENAKSSD